MADRSQFASAVAALFTVILWGGLPVLRRLAHLPPMLVAAVAMASAASVAGLLAAARRPREARYAPAPALHWVSGVGGLVGALYFYFLALGFGHPAQVTLITYTWPLGLVLVSDHMAGRGLRATVVLGTAVAFAAVIPLLLQDGAAGALPLAAAAASLCSGAAWIVFSLHLRRFGPVGLRGYRRLFLHTGAVALTLHLLFEGPASGAVAGDWAVAALIGLGPYGVAFMAWGYALRRGPTALIGTLAYAVPVIAAVWLIAVGWSSPSPELVVAAAGVCGGAVVTEEPWRRVRHR